MWHEFCVQNNTPGSSSIQGYSSRLQDQSLPINNKLMFAAIDADDPCRWRVWRVWRSCAASLAHRCDVILNTTWDKFADA